MLFWNVYFTARDEVDLAPNVWLHSSVGRASHRYRGGHGFESRWSPDSFQGSSFQLLKLENLLRWSFLTYLMLFFRIFERTRKRHKLEWRSRFVRSEQVCFRRDRVLTILLTKLFGQLEKCSGIDGSWKLSFSSRDWPTSIFKFWQPYSHKV